jgi:hypothetical protein
MVLLAVLVVGGCQQRYEEEQEAVVHEPLPDLDFTAPDYASRAIEASGGRRAWTRAKKLNLDCVVTFYKPDGSFHLTEQHHEVEALSNSIRISASEPRGEFVWQLSGDKFKVLKGAEPADASAIKVVNRCFAEAVLNVITAPMRLLDRRAGFAKPAALGEPVRIEGLWYYPIELSGRDAVGLKPYWSKVVFYQNRDSSLVDTICFANVDRERFLAVRGYDYRKVDKSGVLVPAKVEIFSTDDRCALKKRLAKIDYYTFKATE